MRYSSALVLSTLAAGQAAAANIRHAGFHARRAAEQKREGNLEAVDWKDVSYDLSHVDWSSVFATPTPTPSPEPSKAEVKVEAAEPTSVYTPPAAKTSKAPEPKETESSGIGGLIGDLAGDLSKLMDGVDDLLHKAGIAIPSLAVPSTASAPVWVGDTASKWQTTFINDAEEDCAVICWIMEHDKDYLSMGVVSKPPVLSMKLASGAQQKVNFRPGASGACAPVYSSTKINKNGQVGQTWWEFTFGSETNKYGVFDVSHEVYNKGRPISAKGSQCTSDRNTCSFQCVDPNAESCEKKGDYEIINCGAGAGGGAGFASDGGASGGCMMGATSEHIKVTFQ